MLMVVMVGVDLEVGPNYVACLLSQASTCGCASGSPATAGGIDQ